MTSVIPQPVNDARYRLPERHRANGVASGCSGFEVARQRHHLGHEHGQVRGYSAKPGNEFVGMSAVHALKIKDVVMKCRSASMTGKCAG